MKRSPYCEVALLLLAVATAHGQVAPMKPAFEVATVKPAPAVTMDLLKAGKVGVQGIDKAYARYPMTSLLWLIVNAYGVKLYQVQGPAWMRDANFDVVGKLPEGSTKDQAPAMLQTLLEERFKLKVHFETKPVPGYALVVGKGGSTLKPFEPSGPPDLKSGMMPMSLDGYASTIASAMGCPVVDDTGLKGLYLLPFAAPLRAMHYGSGPASGAAASASADSATPGDAGPDASIAPALIGGLKLESRKLTTTFLVVDHVESMPTPN